MVSALTQRITPCSKPEWLKAQLEAVTPLARLTRVLRESRIAGLDHYLQQPRMETT